MTLVYCPWSKQRRIQLMTTDHAPQYWYARHGDNLLSRNNYGIVHWKGFAALFGTIMGCIWLLLGGMLTIIFVLTGEVEIESVLLKIIAVLAGVIGVASSIRLAIYSFLTLRKRVDPINPASHYRKKFFAKLFGK